MSDSTRTEDDPQSSRARNRARRVPKPITPERLHKAALHYLERYASSTENLRRVLERRIERSARLHGTDRDAAAEWLTDTLARLARSGLLDDRAFAEGRARSLHRRGASLRKIAGTLRQKGVGSDEIDAALDALRQDAPAADFAAAIRLAQRRRLGPWRDPATRADRRERDLAALARAGFSAAIARRIVDAESIEEVETALDEANTG